MIPKGLLSRIDEKIQYIQSHRPLSNRVVQKLREQFALEMTYNSNAIEGNQLTLKETFLVISEGLTIKGRSLKDHLEAKNHHEAIHYLYELIEQEKYHPISEKLIRSLQQLVIKEIEDQGAGQYRKGNVMISGSNHRPPEAFEVPKLMDEYVKWLRQYQNKMHPVQLAALAHHRLVHIHPFTDGNGRTARLVMNLILLQKGYPLVIILKNDRQKYYRALDKADRGLTSDLEKIVAQAVERSINIYLNVLKAGVSKTEIWVPLSSLSKKSRFSEKYLNLLARSGKLEAHKQGRIWLSSEAAIEAYLKARERQRRSK